MHWYRSSLHSFLLLHSQSSLQFDRLLQPTKKRHNTTLAVYCAIRFITMISYVIDLFGAAKYGKNVIYTTFFMFFRKSCTIFAAELIKIVKHLC